MVTDEQVRPKVVSKEQGRPLWHLGALLNFKVLGSETEGQFWALEGFAARLAENHARLFGADREGGAS